MVWLLDTRHQGRRTAAGRWGSRHFPESNASLALSTGGLTGTSTSALDINGAATTRRPPTIPGASHGLANPKQNPNCHFCGVSGGLPGRGYYLSPARVTSCVIFFPHGVSSHLLRHWLVCEASEGIGSQPVPPCLRYTRIGGSLCRQLSQLIYTLYPFVYIISSFTEEETRTMLIPSPIDCIPYQLVTA